MVKPNEMEFLTAEGTREIVELPPVHPEGVPTIEDLIEHDLHHRVKDAGEEPMSKQDLAGEIGVTPAGLSMWFRRNYIPRRHVSNLIEILGTDSAVARAYFDGTLVALEEYALQRAKLVKEKSEEMRTVRRKAMEERIERIINPVKKPITGTTLLTGIGRPRTEEEEARERAHARRQEMWRMQMEERRDDERAAKKLIQEDYTGREWEFSRLFPMAYRKHLQKWIDKQESDSKERVEFDYEAPPWYNNGEFYIEMVELSLEPRIISDAGKYSVDVMIPMEFYRALANLSKARARENYDPEHGHTYEGMSLIWVVREDHKNMDRLIRYLEATYLEPLSIQTERASSLVEVVQEHIKGMVSWDHQQRKTEQQLQDWVNRYGQDAAWELFENTDKESDL